ncbi:MAG: hypothetical protein PHH16_02090 [Candidatus Gracilibacteria bacterium]|nr:hypothetical protein [Candidatus Gracilibacteria bacterium]
MNSTQLQKNFPEVYRDFFSKNDLVVSGCFSMSWGNEGILHQSKYVLTRSKIPLKCYIGLKKNTNKKIEFTDVVFFNNLKKSVESISYGKVIKEEDMIREKIQKFLTENGKIEGVTISILSEIPRGHSFGFSDTSFAILSTALYLFYGKTESEALKNYSEFEQGTQIREILKFAWSLSLISRYGNTISQAIRSTFSSTGAPLSVYCQEFLSEGEKDIIEEIEVGVLPVQCLDTCSLSERELPLDYGVIFTGIETSSKQIEEMKESDFSGFEKYSDFIRKDILQDRSGYFFDSFSDSSTLTNAYGQILSFLSIKTVYFLRNIYRSGLDFQVISNFIEHINNQRKMLSTISKENHFAEQFHFLFQKFQKNTLENIGILPIYSSKLGGGCVFIMNPGMSRDTLDITLEEMRKIYPNVEIDYCSYVDGTSHDGIIIEQFINNKIYSKFIPKNQVVYKNNLGDSYLGTHNDILEKEQKGLLIDTISKKIYINGVRLTSKEIPAQNTTSEVLEILLERKGEDVSVKEFPVSSYASNKNEMLGKIVIPLVKIIKETLDVDFPFVCKGGINDFYLKLDITNTKIGIIKNNL